MGRRIEGHEHLSDRYPSFFSFGPAPKFLTHAEATAATPEERIASIWPYIAKRVASFASKLSSQQSANYDPEDSIQAIWIMLREKDAEWEPDRGNYLSFAKRLIGREFCSIREQAHTVEGPRNSDCRVRQFEREDTDGVMTDRKRKTYSDILRVENIESMNGGFNEVSGRGDGPTSRCELTDDQSVARDAVMRSIRSLTAFEALVISRTNGLWGQPVSTSIEIAEEFGRTAEYIKRVKARATEKIREYLLESGHPAVASDN